MNNVRFMLSAVAGMGGMNATIRYSVDMMNPIRLGLPKDVTKAELENIINYLLGGAAMRGAA